MEPLSWSTIFSAAKTGHVLIDDKQRSTLIKKLLLLFRAKRKIVIFGLSGSGKSQFISSLKKDLSIAQRTDVTGRIKFNLEDFPILFIDTPGQAARHYPRKQELTNILKNGVEGIINVVSYGFEENPDFTLDDIFTTNKEVKESFLKVNRKAEIDRLAEWLPLIEPSNVKWIINLVNKADLWWGDIDEVNSHYQLGEFYKHFDKIQTFLNVITIPYCAIIKPYYDTKTSGLLGEPQKEKLHSHFMRQLHNLLIEKQNGRG